MRNLSKWGKNQTYLPQVSGEGFEASDLWDFPDIIKQTDNPFCNTDTAEQMGRLWVMLVTSKSIEGEDFYPKVLKIGWNLNPERKGIGCAETDIKSIDIICVVCHTQRCKSHSTWTAWNICLKNK